MDKKELFDSIDYAIVHALANTHTATIGRVENVRDTTVDVRPVINRVVDGESIQLPLFIKVPPVFLNGGSSHEAYPIAAGDYALLVFTERCFDRWYAGQDFQEPLEMRMHDYSDGFAIVGIKNQTDAITIPGVITQVGDKQETGNYNHDGNYVINGNLTVDGDITCTGRITCANATIAGIDFATHVHGGVDPGTGTSGGPQ